MSTRSPDSLRKLWQWFLVLMAVALVAARVAPNISYQITLPVEEVRLFNLHGLEWDAKTGTVRSSQDDPHFEVALPWRASPVTQITVKVQPIWGNVGTYQFYYIPVGAVEPYFNDRWRTEVEAKIYGGIYPLKAEFPELADAIRLDPPDGAQFILKSVIVRAWPGRHPVVGQILDWTALVAGLAALCVVLRDQLGLAGFWLMRRPRWIAPTLLWVLVFIRLWLTVAQPLKAVGGAIHDDQLFINQATSIVQGHWLGDYNHLTLIKGQGYPLWIASMFVLGVPLVFSQHLLYVVAGTLGYRAWRPAFGSLWRLAVVAVILFNPTSFHGDDSGRVLRNHFCASLALLTFVCASGWFLRCRGSARSQIGWALGTGAAFTALWLTREETIWMTGVLALLALATGWVLRREGRATWGRMGTVTLLPLSLLAVAVTAICALNYSHYHFWGTVEFRAAAYKDAYGALTRIQVGPWRPFVPVSREMREAAYTVSPTFSRMQPYLEGDLGVGWASLASPLTGLPPSERQIHGAGFMWALRDGAAAAGEHLSAPRAMAYYRKMADEINAACDDGRLPALGHRSGFVPPWRPEYTRQLPGTYFEAWRFITTFIYVVPKPPPSSGTDEAVAGFQKMTHTPLSPRPQDAPFSPAKKQSEAFKNGVMKDITKFYALFTPEAVLISLPLLSWFWWLVLKGRRSLESAVLATTALAGTVAITLVVTLVHMTSFVAITVGYLAAAYPLMLLFVALTVAGLTTPRLPET